MEVLEIITIAETQMVSQRLSGATPLIQRRDGNTVTQLVTRKSQNMVQRNVQVKDAETTEENKQRLKKVTLARDGM